MSFGTAAIPEKIHSYHLYNQGERLIGVHAEAEIPALEAMTSTISGPGILGEIEVPNIGHFGATSMDITFRTLSRDAAKLSGYGPHTLTFRADQESYDTVNGVIQHRLLKIVVRGFGKSFSPGKLVAGSATETKSTLEIIYIKIEEAGHVLIELDKFNPAYVVDGVDQMAEILANT